MNSFQLCFQFQVAPLELGAIIQQQREKDAMNVLALAGLEPGSVRSFVLSNDPVPRMWMAANPLFDVVMQNATVASVVGAREWLFGPGIISSRRFLYETVGVLHWLQWTAGDGTRMSVIRETDEVMARLAMDPPWAGDITVRPGSSTAQNIVYFFNTLSDGTLMVICLSCGRYPVRPMMPHIYVTCIKPLYIESQPPL